VRTSNLRQSPLHRLPAFFRTDLFFLLFFFFLKAGSGMPTPQQSYPGVYPPPPQHATVQLSYPLNPGFAGHINTPGMSQFPPYPASNMPSYPPSNNPPLPGFPPTSQPPYPNPMYPSLGQSNSPYPTSELGFNAPAPTSFAPQPQPFSPAAPASVATVDARAPSMNLGAHTGINLGGHTSMNLGGHSLDTAASNVTHTVDSTHTKVRRMN